MAKNPASFQKRQREMDKKRKAEDKRKRRLIQKNTPPDQRPPASHSYGDDEDKPEDGE
jgi:hypothetical protein